MYLMSNCPSPLLGAPGSSSAVKARVDCMVRYRLLGPLEVESEAGRVDVGPPKRRAVLGALLLARGRVVSADRLVEAVWGDDAPERSSASLQSTTRRCGIRCRTNPVPQQGLCAKRPATTSTSTPSRST